MGNYLNEHVKEFWGGFTVGGFAGVNFLFADIPSWGDLAVGYTIRFLGAVMIAAASGVLTTMAVDWYKHKIKERLFKPKENDKEENQKAA